MAMFKTLGNPTPRSVFRIDQLQMNPVNIYHLAMQDAIDVGDKVKDFYPDVSIDEDMLALTEISQDSNKLEDFIDLGEMKLKFD
jgi:hypothetical protein